MNKNKILLEEVMRMIDMSEHNSKQKEILKESVIKKYLKESEEEDEITLDMFDDFGDDNSEDSESGLSDEDRKEVLKRKKYYQTFVDRTKELATEYNADVDISVLDKLLLVFESVDKTVVELFNLAEEDLVKFEDLNTNVVKPEEEGGEEGAIYFKNKKSLYKKSDREEFDKIVKKGNFVIKAKGEGDEKIDSNLYKWLATRGRNLIKLTPGKKFSPEANAQLNFLARILSNKPKDAIEKEILDNSETLVRNNALKIMQDYYEVVADNIINDLIQLDSSTELQEAIKDGVIKALYNLRGLASYGSKTNREKIQETSWDPKRNVSPWIIQVAKNNLIDALKLNVTDYKISSKSDIIAFIEKNTHKTADVIEKSKTIDKDTVIRTLKEEPVAIAIISKVSGDAGKNNTTMVAPFGSDYKYIYTSNSKKGATEKVLEDINNGAEHLKFKNLTKADRNILYKSERKESAPVHLDSQQWEELQTANNIEDASKIMYNIDITSTEIRNVLENALDNMVEKGGVAGISVGTHSLDKFSTEEERKLNSLTKTDASEASEFKNKLIRRKKLAREMVINFMYNFLLSSLEKVSPIKSKETKKQGERSKGFESEALGMWIKDQNEKLLNQIIPLEKSINPDLTNKEIQDKINKYKITLKDSDKTRQEIKNGLRDYLESNKDDLRKIVDDIKNMPAAGYDVEVGSEPILERKLRAKIKKILNERFKLLGEEEEGEFSSEDLDSSLNVYKKSISNLIESDKYSPEFLTEIVKEIINTGKNSRNLHNENLATHKGVYNFIITMLASVYNQLSTGQKRNVISYIFVSAFPRGENSNFTNFLVRTAKLRPNSRSRDVVWDAVLGGDRGLTSIEKALNNYTPERKNFINFLITVIKNKAIDLFRMYKDGQTDYLEDPTGNSGEYENTMLDKLSDDSSYTQSYKSDEEDTRKIVESLKTFMKQNVSKKELDMFILLSDKSVYATNRKGKTEFNISLAASKLDLSNVNARVIKSRLKDKINKFIESGELRDYILKDTGLDISGYAKIQDYLENKREKLDDDNENYDNENYDGDDDDDLNESNQNDNIIVCKTKKEDDFSRPIYIDTEGETYKDVEMNDINPNLHTHTGNYMSGEPVEPILNFKVVDFDTFKSHRNK